MAQNEPEERSPFRFMAPPAKLPETPDTPDESNAREISPYKHVMRGEDSVVAEDTPEERVVFADFRPTTLPADSPVKVPGEVVEEVEIPKDESAPELVESPDDSSDPMTSLVKSEATALIEALVTADQPDADWVDGAPRQNGTSKPSSSGKAKTGSTAQPAPVPPPT